MGRPKLDLEPAKIEQYAMLGLSRRVVAALLECGETVLRTRDDYDKAYQSGRAKRLAQIAKSQWDSLKSGNVTMAIWLGKNDLGQSEKPEPDVDAASDLLTSDPSLVSAALPAGALPGGADDYLGIEVSPALQNDSRRAAIVQDGDIRQAPGGAVAVEVQDQAASVDEPAPVHSSTDTPAGEGHLLERHQGADPASMDREDK